MLRRLTNLIHLSARDTIENYKFKRAKHPEKAITKPIYVNIEIINRCCLRCQMCDIWKNKDNGELDLQMWVEFIHQLKDWLKTFRLTITGGEPFMKKGIWEFIEVCIDLNLPTVLVTSGFYFNPQSLKRLSELPLNQLVVSVDSISPSLHDRIRGIDGIYKRVWAGLDYFQENAHPFLLATNTVIMRDNLLELPSLVRLLHQKGVERIFLQPIQGGFQEGYNQLDQTKMWPVNQRDIVETFQALHEAKQSGIPIANTFQELTYFRDYFLQGVNWRRPFACTAGQKIIHCDAYGNVRMCVPYAGNIGNIKQKPVQEIWESREAEYERRKIFACEKACMLNCNREYSIKDKVQYGLQVINHQMKQN